MFSFTFFWVISHGILKPVKCKICIPVITWNLNKGLYEGFCYAGGLSVGHLFCMLCLTYREYVQNKSDWSLCLWMKNDSLCIRNETRQCTIFLQAYKRLMQLKHQCLIEHNTFVCYVWHNGNMYKIKDDLSLFLWMKNDSLCIKNVSGNVLFLVSIWKNNPIKASVFNQT